MGFWHINNQNGDGPDSMLPGGGESIKRNDMRICQDACTELNPCVFNRTNAVSNGSVFISPTDSTQSVPWRNGRPPLKDFVGTDSILKSQDYVNYPDLQMLPAIAGPIELVYNIPELNMFPDSLVLSRLTVANIFNGKFLSYIILFHFLYFYLFILFSFLNKAKFVVGIIQAFARTINTNHTFSEHLLKYLRAKTLR